MTKFSNIINSMAAMIGVQVIEVKDMTAKSAGVVKFADAEASALFAAALVKSGFDAVSASFRGAHSVYIYA